MNKLPDLVKINIFTTKRIRNSADMKALLDILEFFPEFTPQKWGKDGKPKQAYVRDEMIADFLTPDGGDLFFRNQKPKYEGSFPTSISGKLVHFDLDVKPETKEHVRHMFELGNLLAEFLSLYMAQFIPSGNQINQSIKNIPYLALRRLFIRITRDTFINRLLNSRNHSKWALLSRNTVKRKHQ